jgi:hypothetical protein
MAGGAPEPKKIRILQDGIPNLEKAAPYWASFKDEPDFEVLLNLVASGGMAACSSFV